METHIYFHTNTFLDLCNLKSAKNLTNKDVLTTFRKVLLSFLLLLSVVVFSISCKQNQEDTFENEKQPLSNTYDAEEIELSFFNIDDKLLRWQDFEKLIAFDLESRNISIDTTNIYDNLFDTGINDKNSKVFFTNQETYHPIRIYFTNPETHLYRLSGQNLVGSKVISVFYISNFNCKDPEFSYRKDKVLVVLTQEENKYYSNIIALECGNRLCSYMVNNPMQNYSLDYLQNVSNYEEFMKIYKSSL